MKKPILAAVVALSMIAVAVPVSADDLAGTSGKCNDDGESGNQAHLAVTDEPAVEEEGVTDVSEDDPTPSVADAAANLVDDEGDPTAGEGCTATYEEAHDDYVEVHVAGNQVCYDGEPRTDGGCPTRP